MILIRDVNFKKKLQDLTPNFPFDPCEFIFERFYDSTDGVTYYPFYMRYPITDQNFFDAVDQKYLLQLRQKKIKPLMIMITECWELFFQSERTKLSPYQIIVNKFLENGITENEIYWIVNNIKIQKEIKQLREKGIMVKANFYHFNFFLQQQANIAKNFNSTTDIQYHFASLSQGNPRHHRYGITYGLYHYDLIKKGKVSLPAFKNFKYIGFISDPRLTLDTEHYLKRFTFYKNDLEEFKKILPLQLDNKIDQYSDYNYESILLKNVFINLANETHHPNDTIFITEKTFRSITHVKPFLINGDPGTIRYLKDLGFKTFDRWWDESYDDVEDDHSRIERVLKIINDICSQTLEQCMAIYKEMCPILEHNFFLLKKINQYKIFKDL